MQRTTHPLQPPFQFKQITHSPSALVIGAWILAMIAVPIQRWIWGESVMPISISIGVILQAAAVLVILARAWGLGRVVALIAVVLPAAWLTEYIGHTTGFPFGSYDYTARLQPQIGGVPLLIPLAWLMMLPPAWALAARIIRYRPGSLPHTLVFIGMTAIAFTVWDLFLDPQMVGWNLWVWNDPAALVGGYFGIPWVNYAGWLLASGAITAVVMALGILKPERLPYAPLLIIYVITWLLQTGGQLFFWNLPGSGVVGFIGMGAIVLMALRKTPIPDTLLSERQSA